MEPQADLLPRFLSWWDLGALALFLAAWTGMTWLIERPGARTPSVHEIMARHRMRWMEAMLRREVRIMDATLLNGLRTAAAFFASGVMLAIGGVVALMGQAERMVGVARDVLRGLEISEAGWEAKLLILALVLAAAFMKFVWAHRLFGYCAVLMGAVDGVEETPENKATARKAGLINVTAARSFNRGLRTTYFALALLAWFLGPLALVLATALTAATLYRREFRSASRAALLEGEEGQTSDIRSARSGSGKGR
ncbi:MAG: DUF599 domain-containing protein [Pseudomonadota bacterium]